MSKPLGLRRPKETRTQLGFRGHQRGVRPRKRLFRTFSGRGQIRLTVSPMMKNGRMKSTGRQHTLPTDSDSRVTDAPDSRSHDVVRPPTKLRSRRSTGYLVTPSLPRQPWLATRIDRFVRPRGHSQSATQTSPELGFIDQVQYLLLELTNCHDVHNQSH